MAALEKLSIDTPEQIALDFQVATIGSRFLALGVDTLIQAAAGIVLLLAMSGLAWAIGDAALSASPWIMAVVVLGWFVLYYGYFGVFESTWNGQTPGKRLVGLRVIHTSGRPLSVYEAVLRNIVRVVDQLPGIYAVGILAVFLTERSQRLGDLAASSVVVHEHAVQAEAATAELPKRAGSDRPRYGAATLSENEVLVIEAFIRRRSELDGLARVDAADRIALRLRTRLGIEQTGSSEDLLEDLLAEYRATQRYR